MPGARAHAYSMKCSDAACAAGYTFYEATDAVQNFVVSTPTKTRAGPGFTPCAASVSAPRRCFHISLFALLRTHVVVGVTLPSRRLFFDTVCLSVCLFLNTLGE